ncbi:MAG TPA: pyruvate formate lyase family protein [Clostridia bacterium]|nr:pyruvate formate lyase family protein [Clostridia bacterium]
MAKVLTYQDRLDSIRELKGIHTEYKQKTDGTDGYWDMDDKGIIPPPGDWKWVPESNRPDGKFTGNLLCGKNYRRLLESHPVYIDPMSSIAGGWMVSFYDIKGPLWDERFDYSHLHERQKRYDIVSGIGGIQHFNIDMKMGLELGFGGLLEKVRKYAKINKGLADDFYEAEENVLLGIQNWIQRHADAAMEMAANEDRPEIKSSLVKMAEANRNIVSKPPETFYEAVQWTAWFLMSAVMYNFSGAGGAIDEFLYPYYLRDKDKLSDDEAIFHLACLLVKDNQYYQICGTKPDGSDRTNEISFFMIEAAHRVKVPTSICLRVHKNINPEIMKLSVKYLFEDKLGTPSYLGDESMNEGFVKNGYSMELARTRAKTGCHWCALPGIEYTLNDIVKVNFLAVFDFALREYYANLPDEPSAEGVFDNFRKHLKIAIETIAEGIDFHLEYMRYVFPELVLNLLCHGPIEKGADISVPGTVDYYNMCIDGAGIATVADSLGAIDAMVGEGKRFSWDELIDLLDSNFEGAERERLMLNSVPKYGSGNSRSDEFAVRISKVFTEIVKEKPTPGGINMIPGLFSWANTIPMGKAVGATPNGRKAHAPINHGANPHPGFSKADSPTALARAVVSVQPGWGNTAPLQLEFDPMFGADEGGVELVSSFIATLMAMGGTLLNINIVDKKKILEAHKDPLKYPNLIVRVTGFSAYFASLSKDFRQLVVDRIVEGL